MSETGGEKSISRRSWVKYAGAGVVAVAVAGGGYYLYQTSKPTPTPSPTTPTPTPTPTPTKKPYEGITIRVSGIPGGIITQPFKAAADRGWSQATGAKVDITEIPLGDYYPKLMAEFIAQSGAYDITTYLPLWTGDLVQYFTMLDDYVASDKDPSKWPGPTSPGKDPNPTGAKLAWDDMFETLRSQAYWGGKICGIPLDGDNHCMYYRKDILTNPEYRDKFKKKYGYDLPVPKGDEYFTNKELLDVAEFFTGWDWDGDGEIEYGWSGWSKRAYTQQFWLYDIALSMFTVPWAESPTKDNVAYFDVDTMEPLLTIPPMVKALEIWVKLVNEYAPPGAAGFGADEMRQSFLQGQVLMGWDWVTAGQMHNDPTMSRVKGKVSWCTTPGTDEWWDRKTKSWIKKRNQVSILAQGGWFAAIPKTCKHPDAAFDLIRFLVSPEQSLRDVMDWTGYNPYRYSHIDPKNLDKWKTFEGTKVKGGYPEAESYLLAIKTSYARGHNPGITIPGSFEYSDTLAMWCSKALAKELTPKAALEGAYKDWEKITDTRGREKQRRAYIESLGLKP
ncbi:MAG: extracellular solute-binding protein [Candidatus Bathyarchaeia archaeon]